MQTRWIALGVFMLAVLVRGAVWFELRNDAEFHTLVGDSLRYDQWSRDIAAGDWLSRREGVFYQAPLYPYFLAVHRIVRGDAGLSAARASQVLLGGIGAALLACAAFRLAGPRAAVLAGIWMALWPAAVFFDLQIDKATLDGVLVCAMLLALVMLQSSAALRWALLAGTTLGVLTLNRENALVLLPMLLIAAGVWARQLSGLRRWLPALAIAGSFVAVVLPVSFRNAIVGGEFHLVTSQFGPNFYIGNGAQADGVYRPLRPGRGDPAFERTDATQLAEAALGTKVSPREVSRYWTRLALGDIASQPARWVALTARKSLLVFHPVEIADNNDLYSLSAGSWVLWSVAEVLTQPLLLIGLIVGAIAWRVNRAPLGAILACALMMTLAVAAFYVFGRYRYGMAPMAILAAAGAMGHLKLPLASLRLRAWLMIIIAVSSITVLHRPFLLPERQRGVAEYNFALGCEKRGNLPAAERGYRATIVVNPNRVEARNNLGLLYAQQADYHAAAEQFQAIIQLQPDDAVAHNNLGMALGGSGKLRAAAAAFERAVRIDPDYAAAGENLARARALLAPAE